MFATYDDPNKIPFKWLPPEVLKSREMTPKADVWSYGVLIHELYGIGEPEIELHLLPHYIEHEATHLEIVTQRFQKQQEAIYQQVNDNNMHESEFIDRH
ncbi:unnamed protein product [Heligmosomoides polygyrus]|uniref:Pkinase_Tyr domain-containing protein n=1 Tax=Heligmosomoides polygyrus TaxID=6339 RepID=A0A183F4I2_HELPZ|nr:unnamed protein product [Heligmosomoides polygyrus]